MSCYELKPGFIGQKSFYGKAWVEIRGDEVNNEYTRELFSYGTRVLTVVNVRGSLYLVRRWDGYSRTTMRHINELLVSCGLPKLSAKEWRLMRVNEMYHCDELVALDIM